MPLPKTNRLSLRLHSDDFKSGQKYYGKFFTIIVGARPDSPIPQFAILVSKKTAKHAVDRNRIRRLTSSIVQKFLPQSPIGQYLIIPKSAVLTTPYSEIETDLSSLLTKLK